MSTFSYSSSTNFVSNRIRLGDSDGRFDNKEDMMPRICDKSSDAGVSIFDFFCRFDD